MKKILLMAGLFSMAMSAQARDSFDGCGLGWEVTDQKTVFATLTRGTTNAFVPPVFGMTTGTLGCEEFSGIAMTEKDNLEYVAQNFESLRAELAMGQGEYVSAAAQSFRCDDESLFGQHFQQNYEDLVAPAQNGIELYNTMKSEATELCS